MNLKDLTLRTCERLDQDGVDPTYYTPDEIRRALNKGQRFFCLLTLCIERTATFALTANQTFYTVSSDSGFSDFLVPLRVTCAGARVRPITVSQLDAKDFTWRSKPGTPERYAQLGFDLLAVYKQPAGSGTSLSITYAASPAELQFPTEEPEIEEAYHPVVVDFARVWLRAKEGGQELKNEMECLGRVIEEARKFGDYVRARCRGQQYDKEPPDLSLVDVSAMMKMVLAKQAMLKGGKMPEGEAG